MYKLLIRVYFLRCHSVLLKEKGRKREKRNAKKKHISKLFSFSNLYVFIWGVILFSFGRKLPINQTQRRKKQIGKWERKKNESRWICRLKWIPHQTIEINQFWLIGLRILANNRLQNGYVHIFQNKWKTWEFSTNKLTIKKNSHYTQYSEQNKNSRHTSSSSINRHTI